MKVRIVELKNGKFAMELAIILDKEIFWQRVDQYFRPNNFISYTAKEQLTDVIDNITRSKIISESEIDNEITDLTTLVNGFPMKIDPEKKMIPR